MSWDILPKANLQYFLSKLKDIFDQKVDKVSGKGLSTNDYTTAEKNKLSGIATGAEVNVQSDWNTTDTTADSFIKNKPTIPTVNNATLTIQKNGTTVKTFTANASSNVTCNITVPTKTSDITNDSNYVSDSSYVHTDSNYTSAEKTKLSGIATGAEVNVQSDWNVTNTSSDAFIKNKPTIPAAQVNSDWNSTSGVSEILNKPTIPAAVAVKGNSETDYRTGNVNLTAANIGALATSGGTLTGNVTIRRNSVETQDNPAQLAFVARYYADSSSTSYVDSTSYIRAYADHAGYGANLAIIAGGNLFAGSGEAPANHYNLYKASTTEVTFITSDNAVHLQANGNTIANRRGLLINTSGELVPDVADTATNNSGSIGSNSYKWANGYFTKINGTNVSDYITTGNASFSTNIFADTKTEISQLTLGNGSGATSATTSKGVIVLYSIGTKRITLMTEDSISDDRIIKFPDATGTVALNGDLNTLKGELETTISLWSPTFKDVTVTTDGNGFANITSDAAIDNTISAIVLSPRRASCELWRNETTDTAYRAFVYTRGSTRTAIASQSVTIRLWGFFKGFTPEPPLPS